MNDININIKLNKLKYPELFRLESKDVIKNEIYYLINYAYDILHKK